jgi:hypothetical protein
MPNDQNLQTGTMSPKAPSPRDMLAHALALLKSPNAWCQNRCREVVEGEIVKRSLTEALFAAGIFKGYYIGTPEWEAANTALFNETTGMGISSFNDHKTTTHREVIAALERAMEKV